MILCIGTTPAAQRVMRFRKLELDTVNRALTTLDGVAGKSVNVAKVLRALGEPVTATGFVGGDRGTEILATLRGRGVDLDFINTAARTRQCITVVDETTGDITELVEESPAVSAEEYQQLLEIVQRRVTQSRAVIMSGTLAPGGPPDFYGLCTSWAHQAGALPVVDAQGQALRAALEHRPALVKPNRTELAATVGRQLDSEQDLKKAIRDLHAMGAERVVVTAGKEPTFAFDGARFWRIHSPQIEAVNPIGSGDSVTAAIVWRLLKGDDLGESCCWGAAAGAANALTAMAGELNHEDLVRLQKQVRVEMTSGHTEG